MSVHAAPVAQLDRASASEAEGYRFDSCRGYSPTLENTEETAETPDKHGVFSFSACSVRGARSAVFCDVLELSALYGALFGLFCYATFDLTSLALLRHWTWPVAIVDVSWGSFVTAVSSTLGLMIANWIVPKI